MLGGVQRAEQLRHRLQAVQHRRRRHEPHGLRLERRRRKVERDRLQHRAVAGRLPLVRDDVLGDGDAAERQLHARMLANEQRFLDGRGRVLLRLRVPVARERFDERRPGSQIELAHEIRLAEVEIDRALVDRRVRALALDDAEHGARLGFDHEHRVDSCRTKRDARGRIVAAVHVKPAAVCAARAAAPRARAPRLRALRDPRRRRRFVRSRQHVAVEHARIRVIEDRRLTRRPSSVSGSRMSTGRARRPDATSTASP